ncbi:glycosyltransferase family 2 protein [Klebsiella pneumoniae]|uniref:glycosyltransferase family 2 protein n=1 Tax=Klebsiella pneumoniae TaxID=573 RepID=UPI002FCC9956
MALVTVYITTCNRLELLKRCLNSIKEQTIRDIEIIVADDNSNDDTALFMKSECEKDTRIKYLRNDINRAVIQETRLYLWLVQNILLGCDDDDYFEKDRIKSFVENSDKLEQFVFLYTDSLWLTSRGVNKAVNK